MNKLEALFLGALIGYIGIHFGHPWIGLGVAWAIGTSFENVHG